MTQQQLDQLRQLAAEGLSLSVIAKRLETTPETVRYHLGKLGIRTTGTKPVVNPTSPETLRALIEQGLSDREIGERLGLTGWCVWSRRRKLGIRPTRGQDRIDPATVARLHSEGLDCRAIAGALGVCKDTFLRWRRAHKIDLVWRRERKYLLPDTERERIEELVWVDRLKEAEIASLYGCDQTAISRFLIRQGIAANCGRGRRTREDAPGDAVLAYDSAGTLWVS